MVSGDSGWVRRLPPKPMPRKLEEKLRKDLPGTPEAQTCFLQLAWLAIHGPRSEVKRVDRRHLQALIKSSHEFAEAVAALSEDEQDLIEQEQFCLFHVSHAPSFARIAGAAEWAEMTAAAAEGILTQLRQDRPHGGLLPGRGRIVIARLAQGYARCFGERPSAAPLGVFNKALTALLPHGPIANIGQEQLAELLEEIFAPSVPRPNRGRKRRPKM
jgi:hypothetical protein